jgi:hypothetical protein
MMDSVPEDVKRELGRFVHQEKMEQVLEELRTSVRVFRDIAWDEKLTCGITGQNRAEWAWRTHWCYQNPHEYMFRNIYEARDGAMFYLFKQMQNVYPMLTKEQLIERLQKKIIPMYYWDKTD